MSQPSTLQEKILHQSVSQEMNPSVPAKTNWWSMVVTTTTALKELKTPDDFDNLPDDAYEGYLDPKYIPRVGDTYFWGMARYRVSEVRWAYEKKFILVVLGDVVW